MDQGRDYNSIKSLVLLVLRWSDQLFIIIIYYSVEYHRIWMMYIIIVTNSVPCLLDLSNNIYFRHFHVLSIYLIMDMCHTLAYTAHIPVFLYFGRSVAVSMKCCYDVSVTEKKKSGNVPMHCCRMASAEHKIQLV